MKFKVKREVLQRALGHIQGVVEKKNTLPILANVLLSYEDGVLTLAGTDMEIGIIEAIEVEGSESGSTTASVGLLNDLMRRCGEYETVEWSQEKPEDELVLTAGRFKSRIPTLPSEDFPKLSSGDLPHRFTLKAQDLKNMIDRTKMAMSTDDTRSYLNGAFFHPREDGDAIVLRAVATDGHRLALAEVPLTDADMDLPGVVIPRKTINELRKLLDSSGEKVEIQLSPTRVEFKVGNVRLSSKLLDGNFPDYERVIPRHNSKKLTVAKSKFMAAVERVAIQSEERNRPVKFSLSPNRLLLSSTGRGEAREDLTVTYEDAPFETGFQARFLNDVSGQLDEHFDFFFGDGIGPALIKDPKDESMLFVLMPIRV